MIEMAVADLFTAFPGADRPLRPWVPPAPYESWLRYENDLHLECQCCEWDRHVVESLSAWESRVSRGDSSVISGAWGEYRLDGTACGSVTVTVEWPWDPDGDMVHIAYHGDVGETCYRSQLVKSREICGEFSEWLLRQLAGFAEEMRMAVADCKPRKRRRK